MILLCVVYFLRFAVAGSGLKRVERLVLGGIILLFVLIKTKQTRSQTGPMSRVVLLSVEELKRYHLSVKPT